jgi:hypothetical protein
MQYSIHFIYQNPEFDKAHAEEYHEGQESENNIRDIWEDEIDVQGEVTDFKIKHKEEFILQAQQDDEVLEFPIPNMTRFEFTLEDGKQTVLAASNKIIKKTEVRDLREDAKVIYVYLKGKDEPISPFPGLYVKPEDFPK